MPGERPHGRAADSLRPVTLETGVLKFADGSAQIDIGDTRVLVAATVDHRVPSFLSEKGRGWVTAEYAMLPRATPSRSQREVARGRPSGRTAEIQRLIGRSLRAAVDMSVLGERTVVLDCDVLQADGGTRTASITAAYVAMVEALGQAFLAGDLNAWPIRHPVAAVSVGLVDRRPLLDLEYVEDSVAEVDLNVAGTVAGELIEVQGTGEESCFSRAELDTLLDLAGKGIRELAVVQERALAPLLAEVDDLRRHGRRRAAPRDEGSVWGPPS